MPTVRELVLAALQARLQPLAALTLRDEVLPERIPTAGLIILRDGQPGDLKQHRTKLHSTNPIERLNGEIKRRTDVAGIFPNEASIRRLVGAILMEQTEEWTVQRARYMTLETLAPVCDDLNFSLPAA